MKTKKIILLAFVAVAVFASSCKKEIKYEFPKGLIPYELGQIISFIDSSGQTFDVIVTESNTEWYQESEGSFFFDGYISIETKKVTLKSEANNLEIKLQNNWPSSDRILLGIYINNSREFTLTSDNRGNFLNNAHNTTYSTFFYESLEINGKVYHDVVEHKNNTTDYHLFKQLFYNKTYGILQVNMGGENFLTLNH